MKQITLASAFAVALSVLIIVGCGPAQSSNASTINVTRNDATKEKQTGEQAGSKKSNRPAQVVVTVDEYGRSALMRAAARGDLEEVKAQLDSGAKVDGGSGDGYTPLMFAAYYGEPKVVEYLLEHGADVDFRHKSGLTALMEAAKQNLDAGDVAADYVDTVKALLKKKPDVNAEDESGETALMLAEKYGRRNKQEIVRLLKEAGATK